MLNKLIVTILPLLPKPLVYLFAKKYIAGSELKDAVTVAKDFAKLGGKTTIDVLGEFVQSKKISLNEKKLSLKVIEKIHQDNLDSYLSIKPTSQGLGIDYTFAYENIKEVVTLANNYGILVRLDMENSPYTDLTLKLYTDLRDSGLDNIGFVIQAYMKRSFDDIVNLKSYKPNVRLCKGIYVESSEIAYKDKEQIKDNFKKLFDFLIENTTNLGIATHDEDLILYAENQIREKNIETTRYEFQMLLGVRENRRDDLLKKGHNVRIYVPFGKDWYGYSTRRLKENPAMAGHVFKSLFTGNN